MMARSSVTNHWFVSFEAPREWRLAFLKKPARQTKSFPTETEAKQFVKEMLNTGSVLLSRLKAVPQQEGSIWLLINASSGLFDLDQVLISRRSKAARISSRAHCSGSLDDEFAPSASTA